MLKRTTTILLALGAFGILAAPATAAGTGPQWSITSVARPTILAPGGKGDQYVVAVTNTGGAPSNGETITVTDELPGGLSLAAPGASGEDELAAVDGAPSHLSCVLRSCSWSGVVAVDDTLLLSFPVQAAAAGTVENVVRVSGGGALAASVATETQIAKNEPAAKTQTVFGLSPGGASTALSTVQAGAHPDLTTSTAFTTVNSEGALAANPKDFADALPPGFAGDLVDTPACAPGEFLAEECPTATQVGVITITLTGTLAGPHIEPVYNVTPSPGDVAKLGFSIGGDFFYEGDIAVRPQDYGLQATFYNATAGPTGVDNAALTVWGVPAEAVHDALRWTGHLANGHFGAPSEHAAAAFFTNPTACTSEQLVASFSVNSWEHPEQYVGAPMRFGPIVGCDRLLMRPSLTAQATTTGAYAATGFDLDTTIPQTYNNPEGLATSTLKREVVTLPEGMTVNPSSGAGLGACSEAQYSEETTQFVPGHGCPSESKLASVTITTPSITEHLTGSVYLATPAPRGELGNNPFNSLLALYLIARAPHRGIVVRAPGLVTANESTGQLVTSFDDLPPLPFSLATFEFNQGPSAPLVTPPACGDYTVTAQLTPWSNPDASPLTPEIPPFPISANCPSGGVPPFAPQVVAGTANNAAGSYSPLDIKLSRNDGEQEITGFSSQMPPGLTANLTGVAECGEGEIAAAKAQTGAEAESTPACPAGSEIGHSVAEAGVGTVLAQAPGGSTSAKNTTAPPSRSSRSRRRRSAPSTWGRWWFICRCS